MSSSSLRTTEPDPPVRISGAGAICAEAERDANMHASAAGAATSAMRRRAREGPGEGAEVVSERRRVMRVGACEVSTLRRFVHFSTTIGGHPGEKLSITRVIHRGSEKQAGLVFDRSKGGITGQRSRKVRASHLWSTSNPLPCGQPFSTRSPRRGGTTRARSRRFFGPCRRWTSLVTTQVARCCSRRPTSSPATGPRAISRGRSKSSSRAPRGSPGSFTSRCAQRQRRRARALRRHRNRRRP